jgi:hypothetical protein
MTKTTTYLFWANTLFLVLMGLTRVIFYFAQNRNDASVDKLMLVFGASAVLQVILFFLVEFQGGINLDADSDKLLVESVQDTKTGIFRAKYKDPDSFSDYVFVYDPAEVHFDSYSVNYTRRGGKSNSGRVTAKGEKFPGDTTKRMISLPETAGVRRPYKQPSGSRMKTFVSSIIVQFFYNRGDRTDVEHASDFAKFKAIGTKGRFMVKQDGKYVDVKRSPRPY